jgi:hypothetical protein
VSYRWEFCRSYDMPTMLREVSLSTLFPCRGQSSERMFLIFLFVISTWPLVWGWYRVAIRCSTPWAFKYLLKFPSMKCDPPLLMTTFGTPNLGNIMSWNIFFELWQLLHDRVLLLPILTHNPLPLVCIHNSLTLEKVPCGEGHGISYTDVTMILTSWTPSHKILGILVHGGPKETTLPNFSIGTECSIVSPYSDEWHLSKIPFTFHDGMQHRRRPSAHMRNR